MVIHLSDMLLQDGRVETREVEFEQEVIVFQGVEYKILTKEPVQITFTNKGKKVLEIHAVTKLTVAIPWDRCLNDVVTELVLDFSREVDFKITEEERCEQLDENDFIAGYELDVDAFLMSEILLIWPLKILCKEDCKGLCKVCGKNRNLIDCGCEQTVIDPRMDAFRDIFEQIRNSSAASDDENKEV